MHRLSLVISLVTACGTVHTATSSLQADDARRKQILGDACAVLDGLRHEVCMRIGPPRAPERDAWATARWWLYETRSWEQRRNSVAVGAQIVCASYVAFEQDHVVESDEQCHRVKHYEP